MGEFLKLGETASRLGRYGGGSLQLPDNTKGSLDTSRSYKGECGSGGVVVDEGGNLGKAQ